MNANKLINLIWTSLNPLICSSFCIRMLWSNLSSLYLTTAFTWNPSFPWWQLVSSWWFQAMIEWGRQINNHFLSSTATVLPPFTALSLSPPQSLILSVTLVPPCDESSSSSSYKQYSSSSYSNSCSRNVVFSVASHSEKWMLSSCFFFFIIIYLGISLCSRYCCLWVTSQRVITKTPRKPSRLCTGWDCLSVCVQYVGFQWGIYGWNI